MRTGTNRGQTMIGRRRPRTAGLWTIVLAAGGSSRLGRAKQLVRHRNRPLMLNAVRLAAAVSGDRVVVVVGAYRLKLLAALRRSGVDVTVAVNPRWQSGMASSLARGIDLLPPRACAAMILLTDQPGLTRGDLARLADRWRRRPTVAAAAEYAGRVGAPAILPQRIFAQLRELSGDIGARQLLANLPQLERVPMANAAFDVDTQADVLKLSGSAALAGRASRRPRRAPRSRS